MIDPKFHQNCSVLADITGTLDVIRLGYGCELVDMPLSTLQEQTRQALALAVVMTQELGRRYGLRMLPMTINEQGVVMTPSGTLATRPGEKA